MKKLDCLVEIVNCVTNSIDIEKCGNVYNIVDLPQTPDNLEWAIDFANKNGLEVEDKREKGYVIIRSSKSTYIRFNLYEEDEPYYGNKGDINSLDVTLQVYKKIIT